MAGLTPGRRLTPARPLNNTASQPNLGLSASTEVARKASLNALTGHQPTTSNSKMGADGHDIEVGDAVDVPGGMHGVVKFVGSVRGKPGTFAGVELSKEFAHRGKNDGDVEGTRYFRTSAPGAGIFLPVHRAIRRGSSLAASTSMMPPTPTTPSFSNFSHSTREKSNFSPDPPAIPKFSQSLGPGARAPSPSKHQNPSPSPYRKPSNPVATPARNGARTPGGLSKSAIGPPRFNSPGPKAPGFQKPRTPAPSRPYSRNNSRLGAHSTIDEDLETTPTNTPNPRISNDSTSSFKGRRPGSNHSDDEVLRLTRLLEDREAQLREQAKSLSEMESSLTEIQDMLPGVGADFPRPRSHGEEPNDVAQLRALLREKTDKISMLTAEFDNHRADFRSTIDTLELASTETERVYERKVDELQDELRDMHSRNADVEIVAEQLKQLEELVHELEEGLEDARRGEAEARGEVEFLRGEVERGRSELRQEREKAAAALKGAGAMMDGPLSPGAKEVEQRDDEIRGLKAIIHSLSSGPEERSRSPLSRPGSYVSPEELRAAQANTERLEREKEELRGLVERKAYREEELEREIERLKSQLSGEAQRESVISNGVSEHTTTQEKRSSGRDSKGTIVSWRESPQAPRREPPPMMEPMAESDTQSSIDDSSLWCEICETGGHDILNCSAMGGDGASNQLTTGRSGKDAVIEGLRGLALPSDRRPSGGPPMKSSGNAPTAPLPPPAFNPSLVPPKGTSVPDPDKWCALCESEGHDVTECPAEDAF
ncbi:hypothetical protein P280DRAFT_473273 [Massarina eburnea CBS 473.64]|uniref:CAP-Gly domain-containing protein n=1 Tax=Massarina eburnea CBS 473.64 TaxID=1395130 RepID=A0A6A6RLW4_9PLEO|nr:hypothetical protein P280DRAFT_473273 [Massarina eburnea CBS 473.64]